jgi:hypothetical protein
MQRDVPRSHERKYGRYTGTEIHIDGSAAASGLSKRRSESPSIETGTEQHSKHVTWSGGVRHLSKQYRDIDEETIKPICSKGSTRPSLSIKWSRQDARDSGAQEVGNRLSMHSIGN